MGKRGNKRYSKTNPPQTKKNQQKTPKKPKNHTPLPRTFGVGGCVQNTKTTRGPVAPRRGFPFFLVGGVLCPKKKKNPSPIIGSRGTGKHKGGGANHLFAQLGF